MQTTNGQLLRLTAAVFLCYLTVGMPLPVLPLYVHHALGFGNVVVGAAIGVQFLAAVLTRRYAGRISDHRGARFAMQRGFLLSSVAGMTYVVSALLPADPAAKLAVLLAGRLLLGVGESLLITGCLAWGIGFAGKARAGKVMAWTGMAVYGALAAGSPLGLAIDAKSGFVGLAGLVTLLPVVAWLIAAQVPAVPVLLTKHIPFSRVLSQILRPGAALAMQGVGFAAIGSFITLYFESEHWQNAGLALTGFGTAFVLARLLFGHLPDRFGGYGVAGVSFAIELLGQMLLWKAPNGSVALAGVAISGFGCSLMFPSLGVEAVKRVPAENRGTALAAFAAFQDVSYGITGPITGLVASGFGYPAVFLVSSGATVLGLLLVLPRFASGAATTGKNAMTTAPGERETPKAAVHGDSI